MIEAREISRKSVNPLLRLKVREDQALLVASNPVTIAQAHYEPNSWLRGLWSGELPVGLIAMIDIPPATPEADKGFPTNVLVVSDDPDLLKNLEEEPADDVVLRFARNAYEASAVVESFSQVELELYLTQTPPWVGQIPTRSSMQSPSSSPAAICVAGAAAIITHAPLTEFL